MVWLHPARRDVALHLVGKNVASLLEIPLSECPRMNVHHLELFYYVARFGGISRAVRRMPYGIQQPAVSSQMLLLEQDLGKKLFERIPFRLTQEGEELFAYVNPFFSILENVAASLRKQAVPQLRLGASEIVLRNHLPHLLIRLQANHPGLRITLRSGLQAQMEAAQPERRRDEFQRAERVPDQRLVEPLVEHGARRQRRPSQPVRVMGRDDEPVGGAVVAHHLNAGAGAAFRARTRGRGRQWQRGPRRWQRPSPAPHRSSRPAPRTAGC